MAIDLRACIIDPNSQACKETKKEFSEYMEYVYFLRHIRIPKLPIPPIPPLREIDVATAVGDRRLEELNSAASTQNMLIGELLIKALGDPDPQPNRPTILGQMRSSGIQKNVLENMISELETAVSGLKSELKALS